MKVLMLISNGFEEIEALGTVDVLRRLGVEVTTCSVTGLKKIISSRGIPIVCDKEVSDIYADAALWDAVVLPGGQPNSNTLRDSDKVMEIVKDFASSGKLTCAICAAPIALERAGLLSGRKVTAYPRCLACDGSYEYTGEKVVRDGNIITSKGPGTMYDFAFEIANALGLGNKLEELKAAMMLY